MLNNNAMGFFVKQMFKSRIALSMNVFSLFDYKLRQFAVRKLYLFFKDIEFFQSKSAVLNLFLQDIPVHILICIIVIERK